MVFGPPLLILGLGLFANAMAIVVAILSSLSEGAKTFALAADGLARSSGMWSLVLAQLMIGVLIGFALGLRTPRAR